MLNIFNNVIMISMNSTKIQKENRLTIIMKNLFKDPSFRQGIDRMNHILYEYDRRK